jgi:hypothetical protein
MIEYFFTCPYCWERISMILDPHMSGERYIEDCQVCCNPIEIIFEMDEKVKSFDAKRAQ